MKQKARIRREKERLHKRLQRAARNPQAHREQLQAILSNPVATEYQKNRAKELLGSSADKLDELIAAFDKKPTVPVDSTPAPPKVPKVPEVVTEPESPKLTDEELAKRYQLALEERAREQRAELDKIQAEYEREWWKGSQR
jgi:hypothetical protein